MVRKVNDVTMLSSRRYGLRDVYAEMLHLCRHCNALFWQVGPISVLITLKLC